VNPGPFFAVLDCIESYAAELDAIGAPRVDHRPPSPRWDQDWFPRLDAAAAYALVRREPPRRIVEVGSGHSTRFLVRAIADGGLATRITAIDPEPRASIRGLEIEFLEKRVQEVPENPFHELQPGDILFIDSSHQLKAGSDVDLLFNKILPLLPSGARVHVHDVFLPDEYPAEWAWRRYNEQNFIKDLLPRYAVEFSSHWIASRRPDLLERGVLGRLPLVAGALESSLWLRKN
jgi:predicted O-methyltransferase YrrM